MELQGTATNGTVSADDYADPSIADVILKPRAKGEHRPPPIDLDDAPVTRPFLPPLEEFQPYLERIWANRWLTNAGPFHQQLEEELAAYLGVQHIALTSNGTAALQLALQALEVKGEVITTPFTFVATTHALRSCNLRPVFVDIDPRTGNLDPEMIERAITPDTCAIMPVHCFGHPCRTDRIAEVASRHGLKVIYDAAHAFNVRQNGESLLRAGDAACLSFHATKVFNTFEGGAVVCADAMMKARIGQLRNFGFTDAFSVGMAGTNGKMSEFQAAFGLLQLKYADEAITRRAMIAARYAAGLRATEGLTLFEAEPGWQLNHSYFPLLLAEGLAERRADLCARLLAAGIHARPYFWPLVCDHAVYQDLPSASGELPVARRFARQILCLPLYPDLAARHVETAVATIRDFCAVAET
ncbi:DegT/DnrJ/EryC1/StrS family aminotransferase [Sphingobium bisphenolivorans]|uniref:DegT/DnrJ/EryC1/StrS family aminotransferase n=1 Tax=Sphingobium bisphenolivorans TaxID=1335760 RepID=UPI0003AB2A78|nr:DegT/DnrJ/EryC1/StrS family aminotransferase [Sphingobium bisphenolivorans]